MRRKIDIEIKAGIFIFLGLIISMITILLMGGGRGLFEGSYRLYVSFPDAAGLSKGAYIRSGGLRIGRIEDIEFSSDYTNLKVTMRIEDRFKPRIKQDSLVRMQTQGVLGDKFLDVSAGSTDATVAAADSTIQSETSKDLSAALADGTTAVQLLKENLANVKIITGALAKGPQLETMFRDMNEATANFKSMSRQLKDSTMIHDMNQTLANVKVVSDKLKRGEGTIGALFNDSSLFEDLKNLIGGANRNNVLKFFVRQAVKSSDDAAVKKAEEQKKK